MGREPGRRRKLGFSAGWLTALMVMGWMALTVFSPPAAEALQSQECTAPYVVDGDMCGVVNLTNDHAFNCPDTSSGFSVTQNVTTSADGVTFIESCSYDPNFVSPPVVHPDCVGPFFVASGGSCFVLLEGVDAGCTLVEQVPSCTDTETCNTYNGLIADGDCPEQTTPTVFTLQSGPVSVGTESSVPIVWQPTTLNVQGCAGATAMFVVTDSDGATALSGELSETSGGSYDGSFDGLSGSGTFDITTQLTCPDATVESHTVAVTYYDPSGQVRDCSGSPIPGATVTLTRADDVGGPYVVVPNGSELMSPKNRLNPMPTDELGLYGWDVADGFYVVVVDAGDYGTQQTAPLQVPPPRFNVNFDFGCLAVEQQAQDGNGGSRSTYEAPTTTAAPGAAAPTLVTDAPPNPGAPPLAATGSDQNRAVAGLLLTAAGFTTLGTARHRRRFIEERG